MRLPIRNKSSRPLTLFLEMICDEREIPPGGMAIVRIADGALDSIDVHDGQVTIWDDSCEATIEVVSESDMRVDDAIMLARCWLNGFGASDEAQLIGETVDVLEPVVGYFKARRQIFAAFHDGFASEEGNMPVSEEPEDARLAACYRAGVIAARHNDTARRKRSYPHLNASAPLDTDTVRSAFARALVDGELIAPVAASTLNSIRLPPPEA